MNYKVHGIFQARILEWVAFPFSRGSSQPNLGLPHCRQILYQLSHKGSPRKLEWVAYPFSSRSSWPRNRTRVSCIGGRFFTNWAIKEAQCRSSQKMGFLWRLDYIVMIDQISVVQALNHVQLFVIPWTAACQASQSFTSSWRLPKLMSIESVMPSNHLILWRPLLLLPSVFPSIKVFSNESDLLIRWPKYWSFSFSISPSNEYSGLISFRIHWFDLLTVQGTLKSLLYYRNSKALILQCSDCYMVQLSHPYMTTGKVIALTIWTFVSKVISLFFNMLSKDITLSKHWEW